MAHRGRRPERAVDVPAVPRRLRRGRRARRHRTRAFAPGRKTCVTPAPHDLRPITNPFAAPGVGSLYDHGRPFHHPRSLARIRGDRRRRADRSGARPRVRHRHVDGRTRRDARDIRGRVSTYRPRCCARLAARRTCDYLLGHAERSRSPTRRSTPRPVARVCTGSTRAGSSTSCAACCDPGGWVGLYDHYFMGEMIDVPEFGDWAARRARALPAAAAQSAGGRSAQPRARRASRRSTTSSSSTTSS